MVVKISQCDEEKTFYFEELSVSERRDHPALIDEYDELTPKTPVVEESHEAVKVHRWGCFGKIDAFTNFGLSFNSNLPGSSFIESCSVFRKRLLLLPVSFGF